MGRNQQQWWGVGFVIRTSMLACALLVFNSAIFISIYSLFVAGGPGWLREPKVTQLALFVGPVLFTAAEWWVLDRLFGSS